MNYDVLIIYKSLYHGNTKKLAAAMAGTLNCKMVTCEQAMSENLSQYKIIGLGSGIYFTSNHPQLFEIAAKMNKTQKAFIFSTHGRPFLGKYHHKLKNALLNKGIDVIGEFSCRGYDCTGPYIIVGGGNKGKPNERDEARAAKFAGRLLPQYSRNRDNALNGRNIAISYDKCLGCGKCSTVCPMKVFEMGDNKPIIIKEKDCIHCCLCKDNCPVQAISVHHSIREAIAISKRHKNKTSL